jgi:hypothetical protein
MLRWFAYYVAFATPVLLQAYEAWQDEFLTPVQISANGIASGLPFIAHGGMWSDLTLFAGIMATIMTVYARQWTIGQWAAAVASGSVASAALHWGVYIHGPLPEAHVHDGVVTAAGWIHVLYMAFGLAVLMLFYFSSKKLSATFVTWISILLVVHTIIGVHLPLKIWAKIAAPSWYVGQPILDIPTFCTVLGTILLICGAQAFALRQTSAPKST